MNVERKAERKAVSGIVDKKHRPTVSRLEIKPSLRIITICEAMRMRSDTMRNPKEAMSDHANQCKAMSDHANQCKADTSVRSDGAMRGVAMRMRNDAKPRKRCNRRDRRGEKRSDQRRASDLKRLEVMRCKNESKGERAINERMKNEVKQKANQRQA